MGNLESFFQEWFKDSAGKLGTFQTFASKYLPILIFLLIAFIIIKILMNGISKLITKSRIPKSTHAFVTTGIRILLYFIVILIACSRIGVDITSLIATFSIVGVAISLSIQNTLSNIMAGISMLFTKQFNIDDYVEIAGVAGTVMRIGLFNTKIKTFDGKDIYVPNSNIIAEKVTNYSGEPKRRVDITIGTAYGEKVDKVKASLAKVVEETPEILKDEDIFIGITNFGSSSIDYTVRVWVKNADYWKAYLPMLERIKRQFENDDVEIPFNQLDVHLKQD